MMQFLVFATILSGVLGQLVKIPLGSGNLYPSDLLVIITVTLWVILKLIERNYEFKIPGYFPFLFFFLFWAAITLVVGKVYVSSPEFVTGAFYLVRFAFYSLFSLVVYDLRNKSLYGVGPCLGRTTSGSDPFTTNVLRILVISSVVVALLGFIQLVIYPDLSRLAGEFGYDPHKNRLVSTFLDPNFTAAYLVLGHSLIISLLTNRNSRHAELVSASIDKIPKRVRDDEKVENRLGFSKYWYVFWAIILFVALIFTFSRSGWLMFSAVLLFFGLLKSPKLLLVAFLAGFLAYFAVPRVQTRISGITDPDDSAKLRIVSWTRAFNIFRDNPIFGVGYNLYRPAQERYGFFEPSLYSDQIGGHAGGGSDSSLLLVLATTGVVGLILFLLTFVNIFVRSLTKIKTHTGLILALSLFGLLVDSQFINSLFYPQIMLWIWVLVGLS